MSKKQYMKSIKLGGLKHNGKDILRLENIILKLGYNRNDYRIIHYNESQELVITNQELHRDFKTIRRTGYLKATKNVT